MCTAVSWKAGHHYFGRNLDLEFSFQEQVCIAPRRFPLPFRRMPDLTQHAAIIGMATVSGGYPLYYDAVNEYGVGMAGLNFPGNAFYFPEDPERVNIAPFEFIPWILGQAETAAEVRSLTAELNLADIPFSEQFPLSPLHWMISDSKESLVVESTRDGLHVYENPAGVLTNNPPFPVQQFRLNDYRYLTCESAEDSFDRSGKYRLDTYSRGMGTLGLPGGLDSGSRFVRTAFTALNSVSGGSPDASGTDDEISQFFHILQSAAQTRGLVHLGSDASGEKYEITIYSSCCDTDAGIYYYTTYGNSQITGVDMHREDLDGSSLSTWPLEKKQQIRMAN